MSPGGVLLERCSTKFYKIHRKTPTLGSFLSMSVKLQTGNLKSCLKDTSVQMFACEFYKNFRNSYFVTATSVISCNKKLKTVELSIAGRCTACGF